MWLALCVAWWSHVHFGEKTRNFNVSKVQVPPKSSYPLTQRSWSFGRNPIQLQRQFPKYESIRDKSGADEQWKVWKKGKLHQHLLSWKKAVPKKLHFIYVQTTITKFRCYERDTEEWNRQAALTEAFKISRSFPSLSVWLVTQILSRLPLHECSRAMISQEANIRMC